MPYVDSFRFGSHSRFYLHQLDKLMFSSKSDNVNFAVVKRKEFAVFSILHAFADVLNTGTVAVSVLAVHRII